MNVVQNVDEKTAVVDDKNRRFWNELCGSGLARQLGVTERTPSALHKFDAGYLSFYPYLRSCVPIHEFSGQKVLEIGLGYGTVGQAIAESGADYAGLDIAAGPVEMMNHRLALIGKLPTARQGSMLQCPFPDGTFDVVVSIGCFHHTGNLRRCIDETRRVLKPGGRAYVMVYNKFSYRNWLRWPWTTARAALGTPAPAPGDLRAAYDSNAMGEGAPETVFVSAAELAEMFSGYSKCTVAKRNWGGLGFRGVVIIPRLPLLDLIGPLCGLDLYVSAVK